MCTQPSAANLIANPNMDKDISGWQSDQGTTMWSNTDVQHCPYSGSLTIFVPHGDGSVALKYCAMNVPLNGDFNFGIQFEAESSGLPPATPICQVNFKSGFHCDADVVGQNETDVPAQTTSGWQQLSGSLAGVQFANSVEFDCYQSGSPTDDLKLHFDMAYVSQAPNHF
jgi:hypothetical protein